MSNMTWNYDEDTGRYIVKNAVVRFPNIQGAQQDYNQEGKRNFNLQIDESLAEELKDRGVHVRTRDGREEDEVQHLVKIGVYRDADIRMLSGKAMTRVVIENDDRGLPTENDQGRMVDDEFRRGHVKNGEVCLEFHISRNTRVATSSPYCRVDTLIIPIRKSRLLSEYEDYEDDMPFDD